MIGENVETDAKDGEGKFTFTLTQYSDEDLNDSIESTEVTPLGSSLYFQLAMDNPVSGLIYSLIGEFLNYSFINLKASLTLIPLHQKFYQAFMNLLILYKIILTSSIR